MRLARYQLAVIVLLALIAGFSFSQVCALNCSFNGCSEPKKASRQNERPGHCHQSESQPGPDEPHKSSGCPSHAELSALMSSTLTLVKPLHLNLYVQAASPTADLALIFPPDKMLLKTDSAPFRAPPIHSVLRI
jgi:hypothetical protein